MFKTGESFPLMAVLAFALWLRGLEEMMQKRGERLTLIRAGPFGNQIISKSLQFLDALIVKPQWS